MKVITLFSVIILFQIGFIFGEILDDNLSPINANKTKDIHAIQSALGEKKDTLKYGHCEPLQMFTNYSMSHLHKVPFGKFTFNIRPDSTFATLGLKIRLRNTSSPNSPRINSPSVEFNKPNFARITYNSGEWFELYSKALYCEKLDFHFWKIRLLVNYLIDDALIQKWWKIYVLESIVVYGHGNCEWSFDRMPKDKTEDINDPLDDIVPQIYEDGGLDNSVLEVSEDGHVSYIPEVDQDVGLDNSAPETDEDGLDKYIPQVDKNLLNNSAPEIYDDGGFDNSIVKVYFDPRVEDVELDNSVPKLNYDELYSYVPELNTNVNDTRWKTFVYTILATLFVLLLCYIMGCFCTKLYKPSQQDDSLLGPSKCHQENKNMTGKENIYKDLAKTVLQKLVHKFKTFGSENFKENSLQPPQPTPNKARVEQASVIVNTKNSPTKNFDLQPSGDDDGCPKGKENKASHAGIHGKNGPSFPNLEKETSNSENPYSTYAKITKLNV